MDKQEDAKEMNCYIYDRKIDIVIDGQKKGTGIYITTCKEINNEL